MKKYLPLILALVVLYTPFVADAQRYLVDFNANIDNKNSFDEYINLLYKMSIAAAGLLAVVKIMIAGAKYMLTDLIGTKSQAKSDIQGALLGLLLIIGAVIVLETINPQLTDGGLKITQFKIPEGLPAINSLKVGQPTNEQGETLDKVAESFDNELTACATKSAAPREALIVTTIDVSKCADADAKAKAISSFIASCALKLSFAVSISNEKMECRENAAGAKTATEFADSTGKIAIPNSVNVTLGREFVTQLGNVVTTNITAGCEKYVETLPETQRRSVLGTCINSVSNSVEHKCDGGDSLVPGDFGSYGKFNGSNKSAVTCTLPKSHNSISELGTAFAKYQSADPSRKYHVLTSLSTSEEKTVCEKYAEGTYFDENGSSNSCYFY